MGARGRLTLDDLAKSLGVSKTTVSNAFSRPDQLSPDLRLRILEAAEKAGYSGPDPVARMLKTRRIGALGLILPESLPFSLDDDATTELLRGIADACEERRLGLLIVPGARDAQDTRQISGMAVDGFIVYSMPHGAAALDAAFRRGVPVVVVDQPRLFGVPTVSVDDRGGARDAARHLVSLGHRRIAIVALPLRADGYNGPMTAARIEEARFDVAMARLRGYRDALAEAGVDIDEMPVYECAHSDEELGEQAGRHLLDRPDRPTAILAMSDRLAFGVIAAARALKVDVPKALSVVGFNDAGAAAHSRPALTTVRQPLRLKGYAAARLILDAPEAAGWGGAAAAGGGGSPGSGAAAGGAASTESGAAAASEAGDTPTGPEEFDLPVELVIRRTTAAPR
jgi:DNA-binding LacI/PurR family transcriptional regulator